MRNIVPNVAGHQRPKSTAVTRRNLDAFFNSLCLIVSLSGYGFSEEMIGCMGLFYNKVLTLLMGSVDLEIKRLKALQHHYVNIVRGVEDISVEVAGEKISISEVSGASTFKTITEFRRKMVPALQPDALRFLDRVIFALFGMHRVIVTDIVYDYSTITSPGVDIFGEGIISPSEISEACEALSITKRTFKDYYASRCRKHTHRLITTAGVNGPATWTAASDALALAAHPTIPSQFGTFAEKSKLKWILEDILGCVRLENVDTERESEVKLGRLHVFAEWGGKTRTVALVDYWTQTLFTPLHDTIAHFLSLIASDGTYDQESIAVKVRTWTQGTDTGDLHSFDLTAATDRLPRSLQEDVLAYLLGDRAMATAWSRILVHRDFVTEDGKKLNYTVGQPMGSKSSWAMLAITHHVIVQVAAARASVPGFGDYVVLGDDIVINNKLVAGEYQKIMSGLGVGINASKSIFPVPGTMGAAEICKRVFVGGEELSVLPPKLIVKASMNGKLLPQLQNMLSEREALPNKINVLEFFAGLNYSDKESLDLIVIMNGLPSRISSIKQPVTMDISAHKPSTWYTEMEVTESDIEQAHLYVAVAEQLKRLDSLLRQTQTIVTAIKSKANKISASLISTAGYTSLGLLRDVDKKTKTLPPLNPSHPIVKASEAEVDRIGGLLSKLRLGDADVTREARLRALDMFRNAFVDSWPDDEEARGQAQRSLVTKSLDLIDTLITIRGAKHIPQADRYSTSFSIMLAYIGRLWSLRFRLGGQVMINAVKSRVVGSGASAKVNLSVITGALSVRGRFKTNRPGVINHRPILPSSGEEK